MSVLRIAVAASSGGAIVRDRLKSTISVGFAYPSNQLRIIESPGGLIFGCDVKGFEMVVYTCINDCHKGVLFWYLFWILLCLGLRLRA
jgi:hypothetical protein